MVLAERIPVFVQISQCTSTEVLVRKSELIALACVAQWIERWPANEKVSQLIPSQGTCLDCGPGPWLGD